MITTQALVALFDGTATARRPESGVGSGVVSAQVIALGSKLTVGTRLSAIALLVPPVVSTLTVTVPGTVNWLDPFPAGTTALIRLFDHAPAPGVTMAVTFPCVKTTWPGTP